MSALTEVVTLAHENSCNPGVVDLTESVAELLTPRDMNRFERMCERGVNVNRDEYFLYEQYYEHVVKGETEVVEVSIGITSNEMSRENEATGYGEAHYREVGRSFFYLFHQMSAYVSYLESRLAQENEYFNEFMVSICICSACS